MYKIKQIEVEALKEIEKNEAAKMTVFQTFEWISFLEKNQQAQPVLLELTDETGTVCAYFVGLTFKKFGIKILGSPFEGWLTPDMGFIELKPMDYNMALKEVKTFVFKQLKCGFLRIIDKKIGTQGLEKAIWYEPDQMLKLDIDKTTDDILASFKKNTRKDIRSAEKKGLEFVKVPFDHSFVDKLYEQLEDVFAKQNLEPFYSKDKLYDLSDSFQNSPEKCVALEAQKEGVCVATVLSFGFKEWAYRTSTASLREYQKFRPNERIFWECITHWHAQGVKTIDMVGFREYKLKYNPEIVTMPAIEFGKYPGIRFAKQTAKKAVEQVRTFKSKHGETKEATNDS